MATKAKIPRMASVDTLERLARNGHDGRTWYAEATREIWEASSMLSISPGRLADLLSVFSPRLQVLRSIRLTLEYIETGIVPSGVMRGTRAALEHYESTGEIRGPKTGPFARALRGDESAIVLDVWMAKAFGIPQTKLTGKAVAARCKGRIRTVARRLGWTPAETQAAIWTAAVRRAGRTPARFRLIERTLFGRVLVA